MKNLLTNIHYDYLEKDFRAWLEVLGYSPKTVENLPTHAREFLYYLQSNHIHHIQEVDTYHFQRYYQQLSHRKNYRKAGALSNSYLNKHQQALQKFAVYLRQKGKLKIGDIQLQQELIERNPIWFTKEEIQGLYETIKNSTIHTPTDDYLQCRDRCLLHILYGCGLRRSEAYHLDIDDLDFDKKQVHVRKGKGNKERIVPYTQKVSHDLQIYVYDYRPQFLRTKTQALFISIQGNRLVRKSIESRMKYWQGQSDNIRLQEKPLTLHSLRHSIATHLLQAGMEIEQISQFLGHSSLETTQLYTHLTLGNGK